MKLKNLFIPYLELSYEEKTKFITELRTRRIPVVPIKVSRKKKKVELSSEEQLLLEKVLKLFNN